MLSREDESDRKQTERHGTRLTLKLPSAALSPRQLVGALACTAHRNSLNFPDIFQMSSSHRWEIRPVGITHTRVMSHKHVRMKNTGDDWNVKGWSFYNCEDHCLIWLNTQTLRLHQQPVDALLTRKQTEKKTTSPCTSFFSLPAFTLLSFPPSPTSVDPAQGAASPRNLTTSGKEQKMVHKHLLLYMEFACSDLHSFV